MTTTMRAPASAAGEPSAGGPAGPAARPRWVTAVREVALIAVAGLLYSLVRGLTDDRVDVAFTNAERVITFERALGIFVEPAVQAAATGSDLLVNAANAIYIAYWPIVLGSLAWVLVRRPAAYPLYRNAMLTSGALSLAVFALFPLAPPRFLPEHGFVDTIAERSEGYRDFNASALVNEYAAMPSLHLGWVLLASIALVTLARHRAVRAAAASLPLLMLAAIVLTGNHYLVDGVVGAVIVLLGLAVAVGLQRLTMRQRSAATLAQGQQQRLDTARRSWTRPGFYAWPSTHKPTQRDHSEPVTSGSGLRNASSGRGPSPASRRSTRPPARG